MDKKYELLLDDPILAESGNKLYHIKALRDFGDVKKGDTGGYIEKESNLSHEGDCWVYLNAKVFGNTKVFGNAKVFEDAKVFGNALVFGNAKVCGDARVYGDAMVFDNAMVFGEAKVYNNAKVSGNAKVYGNAKVFGKAMVFGNTQFYGYARVYGDAQVWGYAKVYGNGKVYGDAQVFGNTKVYDFGVVCGTAKVVGDSRITTTLSGPSSIHDGVIETTDDYFTATNIGSRNGDTTFFKTENNIGVCCGCFYGTIDEFAEAVEKTHNDNKHAKMYNLAIEMAKTKLTNG